MSFNIYNNLIDDKKYNDINIRKITIINNSIIFDKAYKEAYTLFFQEIIKNLYTEIYDFNDHNNFINLDNETELPTYYNKKYCKKFKIIFKKNIFLQNYNFIKEIRQYYTTKNLQINFYKLGKNLWKKEVKDLLIM